MNSIDGNASGMIITVTNEEPVLSTSEIVHQIIVAEREPDGNLSIMNEHGIYFLLLYYRCSCMRLCVRAKERAQIFMYLKLFLWNINIIMYLKLGQLQQSPASVRTRRTLWILHIALSWTRSICPFEPKNEGVRRVLVTPCRPEHRSGDVSFRIKINKNNSSQSFFFESSCFS